ncbi:PPE family protein [Mycobacterium attenuatum]|uniref:PPE family protein n=1 Tax=Mycobacterium attenuatum TaxID=2341086 RepID=UPI000F035764|nr:PPE family protein [Mycobacterium attenuatum]VBA46453.1 putative PPE family protein PPE32 [Mycobacterium attenuatum]VBA46462.1 putative PPE family protein PPE32 [Mycobacterium attenuatum]
MVDYGSLPPEINSARIYAGPGASSLVSAAAAWSGLTSELQAAVAGHRSVIDALTAGPWLGPAAVKLLAAVSPFITWLDISAEQAAQSASQASVAATAYETARLASVPPPVIAANRALLAQLVTTNLLGQNTPAIGTTEAQYAEFWAQDSSAMYTYASNAAAATQMPDLPQPAAVVDPGGLADQAVAVFKAQHQAVMTNVRNVMDPWGARISDMLKTLSSPINGPAMDAWLVANTPLDDIVPLYSKYLSPYMNSMAAMIQSTQTIGQNTSGWSGIGNLANTLFKPAAAAPAAAKAAEGAASAAGAAASGAGQAAGNLGASAGGVAAGLGKSVGIGGLSAPASWVPWQATTNPGIAGAVSASLETGTNSFPMAPPLGQFVNGGGFGRNQPIYGFKPSVIAKPPAAG